MIVDNDKIMAGMIVYKSITDTQVVFIDFKKNSL
jgi:hypothetical protein|tara:strand:- start:484 stop:585 length:102 start_codon:yes stop_codon:yes gene_type:complete